MSHDPHRDHMTTGACHGDVIRSLPTVFHTGTMEQEVKGRCGGVGG